MDFLQDLLLPNLPAPVLAHLTTHSTTYWRLYQSYMSFQKTVMQAVEPLIEKVRENPEVQTFILLVIVFFLSLQILSMVKRVVMFWINIGFKLLFFGSIGVIGIWVYARGIQGAAGDFGELVGYVSGIWQGEYAYWKEKEDAANRAKRARWT